MTILCIESFGHWTVGKGGERKWVLGGKSGTPYFAAGTGADSGSNIEMLPSGGPTGQPGTGRTRPAPGAIRFKGEQLANSGTVVSFPLAAPITEYIIGFNLMVEDFDRAQDNGGIYGLFDFHDRIIWTWGGGTPTVGMTLDVEFLGANDETDRYHLNLSQGNNDSGNASLYDGKSNSSTVGATPETGLFDYQALLRGQWYYIELYVDINNGLGSWNLRVDGEVFGEEIGTADTQPNTASDLEEVWIASAADFPASSEAGSGCIFQITDFHVIDASTGGTDNFIYPAVIQKLKPTAESGTDIDFIPDSGSDNSAMVDEDQQNFDTDFNESNTATDKDRFTTSETLQDGGFGEILAVQVSAVVADTLDTAARTMRTVIEENGTEGVGTTQTLTEAGYQTVQHIFPLNPDTSLAWEQAEVEAAEFGYEIVA
jgi:hypothetical protein